MPLLPTIREEGRKEKAAKATITDIPWQKQNCGSESLKQQEDSIIMRYWLQLLTFFVLCKKNILQYLYYKLLRSE